MSDFSSLGIFQLGYLGRTSHQESWSASHCQPGELDIYRWNHSFWEVQPTVMFSRRTTDYLSSELLYQFFFNTQYLSLLFHGLGLSYKNWAFRSSSSSLLSPFLRYNLCSCSLPTNISFSIFRISSPFPISCVEVTYTRPASNPQERIQGTEQECPL